MYKIKWIFKDDQWTPELIFSPRERKHYIGNSKMKFMDIGCVPIDYKDENTKWLATITC